MTPIYDIENSGKKYGGMKHKLMGSQSSHLDNWISNGNTYKTNVKKNCTDSLPLTKTHTITKMNDNISMNRTIAGPMNAGS
jgi:hypothetical protein